jgi:AraC-like DNA-binding protein
MKRAVELFEIEGRSSCSPLVDRTWWARSAPADWFISVATSNWEMCVTRLRGAAWLTVRGPHTKATLTPIPADAEFFGIPFSLGTFMPSLPPAGLVDRAVTLPAIGSSWELPRPENSDVFVDRLVRAGLLVHDPVAAVAAEAAGAANSGVEGLSARTVQRRVARATGLTRGAIRQIRRAETAVDLLAGGVPACDAAPQAGYADQAHLTRSLKRFVGQTPAQISSSAVAFVQDSVAQSG